MEKSDYIRPSMKAAAKAKKAGLREASKHRATKRGGGKRARR
jgi:hypothetical protein